MCAALLACQVSTPSMSFPRGWDKPSDTNGASPPLRFLLNTDVWRGCHYVSDTYLDRKLEQRRQDVRLAAISEDLSRIPADIDVAVLCVERLYYRQSDRNSDSLIPLLLMVLSLGVIPYYRSEGQPIAIVAYFPKSRQRVRYELQVGKTVWTGVLPFLLTSGQGRVRGWTRYRQLPDRRDGYAIAADGLILEGRLAAGRASP